ncbi:MAG: hypothetical protein RL129_11 [Actinomycetota bacterium]|jgi:phosphoserine phosphatase
MSGNFKHSGLILLSGVDSAGVTEKLFGVLAPFNIEILDFEQVVIRERLILTVLIGLDIAHQDAIEEDLLKAFTGSEIDIALDFSSEDGNKATDSNLHIVALAASITPSAIAQIAAVVKKYKGNIDRVRRTASFPVTALEFDITAQITKENLKPLRSELAEISSNSGVDIAVQLGGLTRRAKQIVMLDMDSTLIREEVIDLLAEMAGQGEKVKAITERAMRGEIDFETSLRERVGALDGADSQIITKAAETITLTPGARTLIKTLHKLGHKVAVVSGGFIDVIEPLLKSLNIDFYRANKLEIIDGKLTGKLLGEIIDREAKASALIEFSKSEGVSLDQTIAIGDGANDLGMIEIAGLGIAFNAKPKVKAAADASINTPYLDSVLYLMGITREEIENSSN